MIYKLIVLLQLVAGGCSVLLGTDSRDPRCICDAYYGGLTSEGASEKAPGRTKACMKWHQNNPDANRGQYLLSQANSISGGGSSRKGDGRLPPDPSIRDREKGIYEVYQITCMPPDKNIKLGNPEEFYEDWEGNCPDDMDRCELETENGQNAMAGRYHYEDDALKWQCACDNYQNGAHPPLPGEEPQDLCVTFYERGQHELFPERSDGYISNLASGSKKVASVSKKSTSNPLDRVYSVCTPVTNGYSKAFGEGFQNYGCDHPAVPCHEVYGGYRRE